MKIDTFCRIHFCALIFTLKRFILPAVGVVITVWCHHSHAPMIWNQRILGMSPPHLRDPWRVISRNRSIPYTESGIVPGTLSVAYEFSLFNMNFIQRAMSTKWEIAFQIHLERLLLSFHYLSMPAVSKVRVATHQWVAGNLLVGRGLIDQFFKNILLENDRKEKRR